jgi:hypothetical protein
VVEDLVAGVRILVFPAEVTQVVVVLAVAIPVVAILVVVAIPVVVTAEVAAVTTSSSRETTSPALITPGLFIRSRRSTKISSA